MTGQSLVEQLLTPIFGNWGRLKYLQDAYDTLADGIYTVTGTVRKGSVRLGGEWEGDAAVGFDSLMFRWSMGSGGVGDAAKFVSDLFGDAYKAVCFLVGQALKEIGRLIDNELKQLAEMAATDAAIEAVGGGPEDPVADVAAIAYDAYKIYKIINRVVTAVTVIVAIFRNIQDAITGLIKDVKKVQDFLSGLNFHVPTVDSLIDLVKQRGFEFEKNSGWDYKAGAARIALLPSK